MLPNSRSPSAPLADAVRWVIRSSPNCETMRRRDSASGLLECTDTAPPTALRPEERALRPAQHLDSLHVDEVHHGSRRTRHVDPVDIHRDPGIRHGHEVALPNAPNVELGRGFRSRDGTGVVEVDVRHDLAEPVGRSDLAKLQITTGDGRHRQRDAHEELLPVPGGHDQRSQPDDRIGFGRGILGLDVRRRDGSRDQRDSNPVGCHGETFRDPAGFVRRRAGLLARAPSWCLISRARPW